MKNKHIIVDVETDGPIIGENSMVCFGAVILNETLDKTFYGQTAPISSTFDPQALSVSGFTRTQHMTFDHPSITMNNFYEWIKENVKGNPIFWSDNNGYDASWINYYFLKYVGKNPFGWSSRRIGDAFCGFYKNGYYKWKKHRVTIHTHNPVDDAKGNAEALLYLINRGFKI